VAIRVIRGLDYSFLSAFGSLWFMNFSGERRFRFFNQGGYNEQRGLEILPLSLLVVKK